MMIYVFSRVENIVGRGENAGYLHFLLLHKVFKSSLSQGCYKLLLCGKELIVMRVTHTATVKIFFMRQHRWIEGILFLACQFICQQILLHWP